ncbi:MAG: hypothetical protein HZC28_15380 [Spirochaetes bacterium]|nr:hypothetical protein [Spirochaetota bacterium]
MSYLGRQINDVTLELSLRPFTDTTEAGIRAKAREICMQWYPLTKHADRVSLMLWTSDGSEILDYKGNLDEVFEWSYTIGVANPRVEVLPDSDPNKKCIHHTTYTYIDNPPKHTYRWYKRFLEIIREVCGEVSGKPVRLVATFDPGPEFAKSKFKYEKHPEICLGGTMGKASFVVCYSTLHADKGAYAGYPDGIPEGTLFGEFLGRQSKYFLKDMGFDSLWLSNGFGFGMETWGMYGAVFNGKEFSPAKANDVKKISLDFWTSFRKECPDIPLRTRGTNQTTGRDLASDGVPLREIYRGGFNLEPPPNSPWAALNGDFGLELAGWMSHIAEIPGTTYPYRFYTHDLWFLNSPWIDRYGREPHDIFLPLSIARIDGAGKMSLPTDINFLSIDGTHGETPDLVPNEVIPHVLNCIGTSPDAPGLCTWLYPFDEYHDMAYNGTRIGEVFFGDWFIRTAIGNGFPMNTVISTKNYRTAVKSNPKLFSGTILVTPVPSDAGIAGELLAHLAAGGRLMLYGPTEHADKRILAALNLMNDEPVSGELTAEYDIPPDILTEKKFPKKVRHNELSSGGGIHTVLSDKKDKATTVTAQAVSTKGKKRVIALSRKAPAWNGGILTWVRGSNSFTLPEFKGAHLPEMLDQNEYFYPELLMRTMLASFGVRTAVVKRENAQKNPVLVVSRHRNAFYFGGYSPDVTVSQLFRLPEGAPILNGLTTRIINGQSSYHMSTAWRRECRVLIDQKTDSDVSCNEQCSGMVGVTRRVRLRGMKNATIRFFAEPGTEDRVSFLKNPRDPFLKGDFVKPRREQTGNGVCLTIDDVSDDLLISW